MSHAKTWKLRAAACLHVSRSKFTWMHTANAATASEKRSVREPGGMANCVGFLLCQIRRMPRHQHLFQSCAKTKFSRAWRHGELRGRYNMGCYVLARKQIEVYMDAYGECRDNLIHLFYAAMAELADAADLGSVGQPPCRFKSC